jgi:hypothetical protein
VRPDERGVDPETRQRAADVLPEAVVADLRDDGGAPAEAGSRDGDVRRAPTEHLPECADLRERHAELFGVEVDRHAADRQYLRGHSEPETRA